MVAVCSFNMKVVAHRDLIVIEKRVQIVVSELSCLWGKGGGNMGRPFLILMCFQCLAYVLLFYACNRVSYFFLLFCVRDVEEETRIKQNSQTIMYWIIVLKLSSLRATWITAYCATTNNKLFIRKTHDKCTLT